MKALTNLIKAILKSLGLLTANVTHVIQKANNDHLNIDQVTQEYKVKAAKEIREHNERLDQHVASRLEIERRLQKEEATLRDLIAACQEAQAQGTEESLKDTQTMKITAASKLRLVKSLKETQESLQSFITAYRDQITGIAVEAEMTLNDLEIARIHNSIADLSNDMRSEVKLSTGVNIKEVLDLIAGKTNLMKARVESDALMTAGSRGLIDRGNHKITDSELMAEVEDLLRK